VLSRSSDGAIADVAPTRGRGRWRIGRRSTASARIAAAWRSRLGPTMAPWSSSPRT